MLSIRDRKPFFTEFSICMETEEVWNCSNNNMALPLDPSQVIAYCFVFWIVNCVSYYCVYLYLFLFLSFDSRPETVLVNRASVSKYYNFVQLLEWCSSEVMEWKIAVFFFLIIHKLYLQRDLFCVAEAACRECAYTAARTSFLHYLLTTVSPQSQETTRLSIDQSSVPTLHCSNSNAVVEFSTRYSLKNYLYNTGSMFPLGFFFFFLFFLICLKTF